MQEVINQPSWPTHEGSNIHPKLSEYLQTINDETPQVKRTWEALQSDFSKMIFSSNFIEHAGLYNFPPEITDGLCRAVFLDEGISYSINQEDPVFEQARQEVMQHAEAFRFLVEKLIFQNEDFSEKLFLQAHKILHRGIKHEDGRDIAGIIRNHRVGARSNGKQVQFTPPAGIPALMDSLFQDLNADIRHASLAGEIDPYDLAARYCHRFVNIHPFSDGNGRVCRLLLNTLLLKFAGNVVCFGGDEGSRMEYLNIANKAAKMSRREEQREVAEDDKVGHRELAELVLRSVREQEMRISKGM